MVEGARLEIVYTSFMYHGFKSHALRHALDGELAMPCNLQFAIAGSNSQAEGYYLTTSLYKLVMTTRSYATGNYEPCQDGNVAALSRSFCVPQGHLS